jgi:hypothetical protein
VLQEVVWQRVKFDDLLAWLDRKPLNWVDYTAPERPPDLGIIG